MANAGILNIVASSTDKNQQHVGYTLSSVEAIDGTFIISHMCDFTQHMWLRFDKYKLSRSPVILRHAIHRITFLSNKSIIWSISGTDMEMLNHPGITGNLLQIPIPAVSMTNSHYAQFEVKVELGETPADIQDITKIYFPHVLSHLICQYADYRIRHAPTLIIQNAYMKLRKLSKLKYPIMQYQSREFFKEGLDQQLTLEFISGHVYQLKICFQHPHSNEWYKQDPAPFSDMKVWANGQDLTPQSEPEIWSIVDPQAFGIPAHPHVFTLTFQKPPNVMCNLQSKTANKTRSTMNFSRIENSYINISWLPWVPDGMKCVVLAISSAMFVYENGTANTQLRW
jgi:hypothetical protein